MIIPQLLPSSPTPTFTPFPPPQKGGQNSYNFGAAASRKLFLKYVQQQYGKQGREELVRVDDSDGSVTLMPRKEAWALRRG